MAVELDLLNTNSLANITTNFERVEAALQDTVSRSGAVPNEMNADLDMDGNDILNIGTIQVNDITIGGENPQGILERALEAVEDSEAFALQSLASADDAEQFAIEAALSAELAKNNWTVSGPFTGTGSEADYLLTADPGTAANMIVIVGGVTQLVSLNDYSLVYVSTLPYIRITVPLDVDFEVRSGEALDIAVPADGSVTLDKLVPDVIHTSPNKTTAVDADEFWLWNSVGSVFGRMTFANLKASLKTYFDTLYLSSTVTPWVAYVPTFTGFGTVTNIHIQSRRVGDTLEVKGRFASGTPTAVTARVTLGFNGTNGGLVIDPAKATSTSIAGSASTNLATGAIYVPLEVSGRSDISFAIQSVSSAGDNPANADALISSGNSILFSAKFPITGW